MKVKVEISRKILRLLYEMLGTLLMVVFFHVVFLKYDMVPSVALIVGAFYICTYLIRDKVYSYGKIVFLHLLLMPIAILVPLRIGTRIILGLLVIHLMFESVEYGIRRNRLKELDDFPWTIFAFGFIAHLFAKELNSQSLETMSYVIPLIMLFIYYLMTYLDGVKEYIDSTKDVSGLPLKRIIKTNSSIVMLILFLIGISVLLCRYIDFQGVIKGIINCVIYIIRIFAFGLSFIFKLLSNIISHDGVGSIEVKEQYDTFVKENQRDGLISSEIFLEVFFVLFVLYVSYLIIRRVIKRLMMHRIYEGDVVENIEKPKKDIKEHKSKKKWFFKESNEEKIRKYYKFRILKERYDLRFKPDLTPREIQEELLLKEVADVSEITELYTAVRYGNCMPDKAMVKKASRLSKE